MIASYSVFDDYKLSLKVIASRRTKRTQYSFITL